MEADHSLRPSRLGGGEKAWGDVRIDKVVATKKSGKVNPGLSHGPDKIPNPAIRQTRTLTSRFG
jgi:hypothetical protein